MRRAAAHLSHGAQEHDDRCEVLAHLRDAPAVMRRACFTGACAERATVQRFNADVVDVAFGFVGYFEKPRLVSAD